MRLSIGATQVHRIDATVIGQGLLAAMAVAMVLLILVAARETLVPHFEAGSEEIVLPPNLV
ncbi:MAG TPA: hypothetical protein VH722_18285 [Alphaproteobacteria bacterium]|jgi:hypothetical protein|nr:hypothetical protein [Alphaproteobacteria bacterium]